MPTALASTLTVAGMPAHSEFRLDQDPAVVTLPHWLSAILSKTSDRRHDPLFSDGRNAI